MERFSGAYEILIQRSFWKEKTYSICHKYSFGYNYKGTTEQFLLHFNQQFRQLEEISEESEHFPPQIKLQLVQNAVRPINDLGIVEKLDEFQSIRTGFGRSSSLKYQTYYDHLINACVRYDRTKKANVAKRGHIYETTFTTHVDDFISQFPSETPASDPYMGIDKPSDEFDNININQSGPPIAARHKLQPRLLRSNPNTNQIHFQRNQPDRNGLVLYTWQDIYTNC